MRITDQKTQEDIKFNQFKLFSTYIPGQSAAMATRDYQAELTQNLVNHSSMAHFRKT